MGKYKFYNEKLDIAIADLELQRQFELESLKMQLDATIESVKPINLLKQTFTDFKKSPDMKQNLLGSAVSIAGGYISKRFLFGKSSSFIKKALGYAIQYGITNFISKKVTER